MHSSAVTHLCSRPLACFYRITRTILPVISQPGFTSDQDRAAGGGVGKIVHFGRLPVNLQLQAYYNVATPDNGADWQLRFQFQFLFPK
ncbi:MAG: hypothetical protein WB853_02795 [Desulfobacterales bacterium]